MATPTLHKLDPDIYDRIVASGALEGEPVELVDGLLMHWSQRGPEHAALVQSLTTHFAARPELLRVRLPRAVPGGRPAPDIALAPTVSSRHHPTRAELVVEIAVTSQAEDQAKLPGYAGAGVPAVWLIDLPARCVRVLRRPVLGRYTTEATLSGGLLDVCVRGIPQLSIGQLFAVSTD